MKKRNRFGHWLKTVSFILTFLEFYQLLDTLGKFLEHIGFGRVFFFKRLNALPAELIKDLLNLFAQRYASYRTTRHRHVYP